MSGKYIFQIQPRYADREGWLSLALEHDLYFEVLELTALPFLNGTGPIEECKSWYKNSGRVSSLHGCFIDINPASADKAVKALSRDRCRASCDLARELGAARVIFHSSCFPFLRGAYLDNWAKECAEFYSELAEDFSLEICIENSYDLDPQPIRTLMDRISDRRVGVCLDVGHANYSREPLEHWISELGDRISYIHLSDNAGQFDDHLTLGEGNVRLDLVFRYLKEREGVIPVTLEMGSVESASASLRFMYDRGMKNE